MTLSSQVPPLSMPRATLAWVMLAAFAALWLLFAVRLVRWIGNALFGLEAWYEHGTSDRDETLRAEQPETLVGTGRMDILRARASRAWQRWRAGAQLRLDRLLKDECGSAEPLQGIADQIRKRPDATTLTREQVLELIRDLAEPYYQTLWQSFAPEQKLAFVQLAQDGFVNPRNWDDMRAANRKGLVRRTPAVRFVSEAFRRFVASVESPGQIAKWETSDVQRSWADTRTIASAVLVIAAVAMVLTRPDVFESWVGIATGVVGGVPVFMRLVGMASSRGDAKKSEG